MRNRYYLSLFKILIIALIGLCSFTFSHAQNLYRNSVPLHVTGTASLFISNSFTNETSSIYQNDGTVTINGNITNNQTTTMTGTGLTNITGTSAQQLLGNQAFFTNNVVLNNTSAGSSNIVFNGSNNLIVNTSATLTDGIVVTNSNNITFNNASTYSGASDIAHVNGFVKKIGNQAFIYPVGDGSKLRIASIAAPTNATDAFTGKFIQANPNAAGFNPALKQAVLDEVSTCEFWTIDRTTGASNVAVTLSWLNSAPYNCLGTVNPADYYIGRWSTDSTKWISHANGSTTGTSASGTITTRTTPTVFGPFTLAKRNIPLPVSLDYFKGKNTLEGNVLSWKITSFKDSKSFNVERSCNGIDWIVIDDIPSSSIQNEYSIIDPKPCEDINYYRLVEYSKSNQRSDIQVIVLYDSNNYEADFELYPNPNNGTFNISIKGDAPQYRMDILDVLGKKHGSFILYNGLNLIDCSNLASGVYLTQFKLGKKLVSKKIVINL